MDIRALALVALTAGVLMAGCGAESEAEKANRAAVEKAQRQQRERQRLNARYADDPAAQVIRSSLLAQGHGQFGRAWDRLHPAHQALVDRGRYERCMRQTGFPTIDLIDTVDVYDDPLDVAYIPQIASRAVALKVVTTTGVERFTGHAVEVDGRWHWILSSRTARGYRRGGCPG
jgi:hypothetical protein